MVIKSLIDKLPNNAANEVALIRDKYYYVSSDYKHSEATDAVICEGELPRGKLIFRYGAMGSSKTAHMLMVAFNYEERHQKVLVAKPAIENRDGELVIKSRIGLQRKCVTVESLSSMDIDDIMGYNAILVDEAQFCTRQQIDYLAKIADFLGVTVICFGLRTDKKGCAFEGSMRLLEIADELTELKTVCHCGKKATFNARYNEHGMITDGAQIEMGGNDSYISVCRKHFATGNLFGDSASSSSVAETPVKSNLSEPSPEIIGGIDLSIKEYADYIVISHTLVRFASSVLEGLSLLNQFANKLEELHLSSDKADFKNVYNYYRDNGNFKVFLPKLKQHQPPQYLVQLSYLI